MGTDGTRYQTHPRPETYLPSLNLYPRVWTLISITSYNLRFCLQTRRTTPPQSGGPIRLVSKCLGLRESSGRPSPTHLLSCLVSPHVSDLPVPTRPRFSSENGTNRTVFPKNTYTHPYHQLPLLRPLRSSPGREVDRDEGRTGDRHGSRHRSDCLLEEFMIVVH